MNARAIGYVRVSKAREEMISPELQITAITDYCQRNNATLIQVVTDLDATGRNFAREGIQAVINQIETGAANLVVVWKWSRFGRNVRDCLVNIDRLEVAGGRLIAATEDFDDTPVGRFGRGQFLLMAQFESERIGEQWKEAQARRLRQGLPYNGRPRYGYTYSRAEGYLPDPITAPILVSIYERYLSGETPQKIADWLNAQGHRASQGGTWRDTTVQQVMETGFAAGLLRVNTRTGPQRKAAVPRYEPGIQPPIIDMKTWEAYLRHRLLNSSTAPYIRTPQHAFAGLAVCGTCLQPMYRQGGTGKLSCSGNRRGQPCPRPAHTIIPRLQEAAKAWLLQVVTDIDERALRRSRERQGRSDARTQVRALAKEATRLDAALVKLTRDFAQGLIPSAAYISARDSLQAERASADRRLAELTEAAEAPSLRLPPSLLGEWDSLDQLGQRQILTALLTRIEVHPQGKGRAPRVDFIPKWNTD